MVHIRGGFIASRSADRQVLMLVVVEAGPDVRSVLYI